jgi:hypothetical protein
MLEGTRCCARSPRELPAEVYLARPVGGAEHVIAEVMRGRAAARAGAGSLLSGRGRARCSRALTHNVARRVRSGITLDGRQLAGDRARGESLSRSPRGARASDAAGAGPLALQVCDGWRFLHRGGGAHGQPQAGHRLRARARGRPGAGQAHRLRLARCGRDRRLARPRAGTMLVEPEYLGPGGAGPARHAAVRPLRRGCFLRDVTGSRFRPSHGRGTRRWCDRRHSRSLQRRCPRPARAWPR